MKIILANPRGFCAGVNVAIECVNQVLAIQGPPIYVYHEIVHNRHVVEDFKARGVKFVDDVADVPEKATLVYSAHGVSPAVRQAAAKRKLVQIDASCPLVIKVHMEVLRYVRDGFTVLFIGHANHDEAVGTVGEAPQSIRIVESPEDVAKVQVPDPDKVAFVTQTTLSVSDAQRTIAALKARFPRIRYPAKEDICYATTNRQQAVSELSAEADIVLVIGSENSSNSQRLVDRAREAGKPAYLIDDQSRLDPSWFAGSKSVLVTAGASAPEYLVNDLLERLKKDFGGEVEVRTIAEEEVAFELPRSVRRLAVVSGQ